MLTSFVFKPILLIMLYILYLEKYYISVMSNIIYNL